jgi:hypothetical protein
MGLGIGTMIAPLLTSLIAIVAAAQTREPVRVSSTGAVPARAARASGRDDSVRTVRAARRAQEQFEALRRANLPFRPGAPRGPCDLQVGRLCYWHDGDYSMPEVPEPERIAQGRDRLLATLTDAGRSLSGDEWIVGQRIRYLLEARRRRDAIDAAKDCASTPWWCTALAGLALHAAGAYDAAESAYDSALAAMPADQRCKWTDISMLLDGEPGKRYRRFPCTERRDFERRFWWLSQPLYAVAGNELRTEFFARRTMARLEQQARSAYNLSWGSDVEELLMRFGWPTWWTRDHPSSVASPGPPVIVGHEPSPSFFFHPSARLLERQPGDAVPEDWDPRAKLPPARYAPAYAAGFAHLEAQIALFRRGDSAQVVAAYETPSDSLFEGGVTEAALAAGRDDTTMTVARHIPRSDGPNVLVARTAWGPMLVSVEATAAKRRGVARTRFGIGDARFESLGRLSLSDVLLYNAAAPAPTSLDGASANALGAARVTAGGRVGAYWEVYGVRSAGELLSVTITVERIGASWRARAAERLRLGPKATPLRVRWQEVPTRDSGIANRAIVVDLAMLPPGRYRMALTVAAEDGSSAMRERVIDLVSRR